MDVPGASDVPAAELSAGDGVPEVVVNEATAAEVEPPPAEAVAAPIPLTQVVEAGELVATSGVEAAPEASVDVPGAPDVPAADLTNG